jgi:glycosyltransferase involved in cell wall biosynthesis
VTDRAHDGVMMDTSGVTPSPWTDEKVDVVLPCYNESPAAIAATLAALRAQASAIGQVILVDDHSTPPIACPAGSELPVTIVRLPRNVGISAARNEGIRHTSTRLVACVNIEILVRDDWVAVCRAYLQANPAVGVVAAPMEPARPNALATRWRMRFQETHYPDATGPVDWGTGHALLFRREAFDAVGGFDESRRKASEDVDISRRLRASGHGVHLVAETGCLSIQADTLYALAKAEFNRFAYRGDTGNGLLRTSWIATSRMLQRSLRHVIFLRWPLLLPELGVWAYGLRLAWRHR